MPLKDNNGRTWAHRDTCKAGDILICDGGFTCLKGGQEVEVHADPDLDGEGLDALYVTCEDWSRHYLTGQLDFDGCGALVGFYPKAH